MTEPWQGPLTAEEQAMIDAAWVTQRDALNVAAKEPSDRPKTLLEGFGEATEQVVALRDETERQAAELNDLDTKLGNALHALGLEHAENEQWKAAAKKERECSLVIEGENERLRAALQGIRKLVDEQAEDDALWFLDVSITEAYLQQELRKLHAVVELASEPSKG